MSAIRFLCTLLVCATAYAGAISGEITFSSNVVLPSTRPSSLRSGSVESNSTVFGFLETSIVLAQARPVDIVVNGAANYNNVTNLTPGSLPVGMRVESWYFHFDPAGTPLTNRNPGTVQLQFDPYHRIAGIQLLMTTLGASANASLAMTGVTYETRLLTLYGLELSPALNPDWIHVLNNQSMEINLNGALARSTICGSWWRRRSPGRPFWPQADFRSCSGAGAGNNPGAIHPATASK